MIRVCDNGHAPARVESGARCRACERSRVRPSPAARGYGPDHQRARAALAASLPAPCVYCGVVILPGERFDACHLRDGDPSAGWAAGHPACNQAAKGRSGAEGWGRPSRPGATAGTRAQATPAACKSGAFGKGDGA
jgi:hypothetical protein